MTKRFHLSLQVSSVKEVDIAVNLDYQHQHLNNNAVTWRHLHLHCSFVGEIHRSVVGFHNKAPVISIFRIFFVVKLKERSSGRWTDTLQHPCDVTVIGSGFNCTSVALDGTSILSNNIPYLHFWAFYQIRNNAGCICAGNAGIVFRHRLQKKPLDSDPDMHHGTCVTRVPQWMSGSLTRGGGETFPAFPAHAQPAILSIF